MKNPHNFLTELTHFIEYCNEFYNIQDGVYPIADSIQIKRAIGEYLIEWYHQWDKIDIQFDSVDRELVRAILERNVNPQ